MTYDEAIKIIKECVSTKNCKRDCFHCSLAIPSKDISTAYDIAIKAIEYMEHNHEIQEDDLK